MTIAVLGSGNGGGAVAFDCAAHGHQVNLFDFEQFPDNIKSIQENGGVYSEEELEGFAPIKYAGHDIERTLDRTEIIFCVGAHPGNLPGYGNREKYPSDQFAERQFGDSSHDHPFECSPDRAHRGRFLFL